MHAHVGFDGIGQVGAERAVGSLVIHQFALFGQGQARQVVQRFDVGRLHSGGLPFAGIELVLVP